jgi:metal-responsive CopG/Arc/MetJ family transcriptional regulator
MPARSVRITFDEDLLRRIDADPEARIRGRSAFIRSAVESYLAAKERQEIAANLERSYAGQADLMLLEIEDLLEGRMWPAG